MSVAAAHYAKFKEQAVQEGFVYTFTEAGEYLVFPVGGAEVIPFWSSRSRLEKVSKDHPKYLKYQVKELALADFLRWLPDLGRDGIHIGTNWSGKRLTGYDVEVADLSAGLQYWLDKLKSTP
jgi:hypothetical protein